MKDTPTPDNTFYRSVIVLLLLCLIYFLYIYAPLVPKVIIFMDDVHAFREKATKWEATAEAIQRSLASLEKKFSFLKAEIEQQQRTR